MNITAKTLNNNAWVTKCNVITKVLNKTVVIVAKLKNDNSSRRNHHYICLKNDDNFL